MLRNILKRKDKSGDHENNDPRRRMSRQQGTRGVEVDPGDANNNDYYRALDSDAAETALIASVEEKSRGTTQSGSDGFRPAVDGERAPLGISNLGHAFGSKAPATGVGGGGNVSRSPQNVHYGRVVGSNQSDINNRHSRQSSHSSLTGLTAKMHRRKRTAQAQKLLAFVAGDYDDEKSTQTGDESGSNPAVATHVDDPTPHPFAGALQQSKSYRQLDLDDMNIWDRLDTTFEVVPEELEESEGFEVDGHPGISEVGADQTADESYQNQHSQQETFPLLWNQQGEVPTLNIRRKNNINRCLRFWKAVAECLNPFTLFSRFVDFMSCSFLLAAIPCWCIAWILYYQFGNPHLDFLPGEATLSWWFNFIGRHLLLMEIARILQYIYIDFLVLSTKVVVTIFGASLTIFSLQSRGWPFMVSCWGILALLLLNGDSDFQKHWLHFTGIGIYSNANSGFYIIESEAYLRVLIAAIFAGFATTLKRTILSLYFGRRNFETYKPRLERILNDIIIITEVAELAAEAEIEAQEKEGASRAASPHQPSSQGKRGTLQDTRWSSVKFKKDAPPRTDSADSQVTDSSGDDIEDEDDDDGLDDDGLDDDDDMTESDSEGANPQGVKRRSSFSSFRSGKSNVRRRRIKDMVGRWEDPVNKMDKKEEESTVNDILKFRKALIYMDLEHPFSVAFGPASNRDELISSAEKVYARLLQLAPERERLPYAVLSVLAWDEENSAMDKDKKRSLENNFRPDRNDEVTLLAFIQSCDNVYKKLRFFRASVGNSSVIDNVLEGIVNCIFYFVLVLVVLSLLKLNPWPLLVSMSTLLVTFAFAFGPSAAKAIEGILLIVGRRPYDIGDRIIISDSPGGSVPGVGSSWLVEDITLFSTTLRYAGTNELATVSNGSIANARISNCARSSNAIVVIDVKLQIAMHEDRNVELMLQALEKYIVDNSNVWQSIVFFRCEEINTDGAYVMYKLAVRSHHTWQYSGRLLMDRARLHQFTMALANRMELAYDSPHQRKLLFYGGRTDSLYFKPNNNKEQGEAGLTMAEAGTLDPAAQEQLSKLVSQKSLQEEIVGDILEEPSQQTQKSQAGPSEEANSAFLSMIQQAHES